jgi:hypothetical protein
MKRLLTLATAALALAVAATTADAQIRVTARSGNWQNSQGFNDAGQPQCMLHTSGNGRYFHLAWNPDGYFVHLRRSGWRTTDAQLTIELQIDRDGFVPLNAVGSNDGVGLSLSFSEQAANGFLSDFMAGNWLQVRFPGSEQTWVLDLEGSRVAGVRFLECIYPMRFNNRSTQPHQPYVTQPHQRDRVTF